MDTSSLMEQILNKDNLNTAYLQVVSIFFEEQDVRVGGISAPYFVAKHEKGIAAEIMLTIRVENKSKLHMS